MIINIMETNETIETYKLEEGWVPLKHKFLTIETDSFKKTDVDFLDIMVTDKNKIKIYLDPDYCDDNETKSYYKKYKSKTGFTMGEIFTLIVKTYWEAVYDIFDNDDSSISSLAITAFNYDEENGRVYPLVDS